MCASREIHRVIASAGGPVRDGVAHAPDKGISGCWPLGDRLGPLLEFAVPLQLAWQWRHVSDVCGGRPPFSTHLRRWQPSGCP